MAARLEMTSQGYGKIERDETDVPFSRLELICQALGTTLQDLAAYGETKTISNNTNSLIGDNSVYQIYTDQALAQENQFLKEKIGLLESKIKDLEKINGLLEKQLATPHFPL
jgi:transcriptional regulator with XRE-family HTH domain